MDKRPLKPFEINDNIIKLGMEKTKVRFDKLMLLSILAGAFIAFAASGSNMAAYNLFSNPDTYGLGKALAGALFGTGLMLVVIAGGELFTGNTLILSAVCDKKVKLLSMLKNWTIVYAGNFIGSMLIAYMISNSGTFDCSNGLLGAVTLKIAVYKVGLDFSEAFYLGIMCNWLVCLAVWMASAADTLTGKIFAIFFPIWLFITSGFEHSVANMYYIPAGIMAKHNQTYVNLSGLSAEALDTLNWTSFAINNLVPVTLGNIVGGGVFVGVVYWYIYKKS